MYTCFAIDDEYASLEILTDYISAQPDFELIRTFTNPLFALEEISKLNKPVDVIFLDIEMPQMNGIELAKLIRNKTNKLVFTTAYSNYAMTSYELEADGFLLKPISPLVFNKTARRLFPIASNNSKKHSDFIIVKSREYRNRLLKIKITHIIAVEAEERATKIYTSEEVIYSNSSLSEITELLVSKQGFYQIHRSFIISENHVKTLERTFVILSNGLKISIGRKYWHLYHVMSENTHS